MFPPPEMETGPPVEQDDDVVSPGSIGGTVPGSCFIIIIGALSTSLWCSSGGAGGWSR